MGSTLSAETIEELKKDINDMLSYASYNGIVINSEISQSIQGDSIDDLLKTHNLLVENIHPATPKSIRYIRSIQSSKGNNYSIFFKYVEIRNLLLLGICFLITFITLATLDYINYEDLQKGILQKSGSIIYNLMFLVSISGLGVIFHLLQNINQSLIKNTLIPEESMSYLPKVILGIMAGLFLSEIILLFDANGGQGTIMAYNKMILALVGGFSSEGIFSILQAIIDRIKNTFINDKK